MGIGAINQAVYIRGLHAGVTMYITDVELIVPSEEGTDWWPTWSAVGGNAILTKRTSVEDKKKIFPQTVSPSAQGGLIGTLGLSTLNVTDSGTGPSARIRFALVGKAVEDGVEVDVDQVGSVLVETSEWGGLGGIFLLKPYARPDTTNVIVQLGGTDPVFASNSNDALQSPRGIELLVTVDVKAKKLGLKAIVMQDGWHDAFNYALKGIFFAHEAGVGWAIGAAGLGAGAVGAAVGGGFEAFKAIVL